MFKPDGAVHRVVANSNMKLRLETASAAANSGERNMLSPTNLQLTVHLNKNCLVNWNARNM